MAPLTVYMHGIDIEPQGRNMCYIPCNVKLLVGRGGAAFHLL